MALTGKGILVTRPAAQAEPLMRRLADQGAVPLAFPALAILPPADLAALNAVLARLADYHLAIFISPNAVDHGLAAVAVWPELLPVAAVGKGTAARLHQAGFPSVLAPAEGADSEHLLALLEGADMAGKAVLLFRGQGGRELLADRLTARGARVEYAECYRRAAPPDADPAPVYTALAQGRLHAVTAFSSETIDHLLALTGHALLRLPLFAPHDRIAAHARSRGFAEARATPPGEDGLVAGLVEYFGHV